MNIGPAVESFARNVGFKDAKKGRAIIIGGAALIVVGIVAYTLIKWKKNKEARKYTAGEATDELKATGIKSTNLTITNGHAILVAQNLLGAMNQVGTDEQAIIDNLNTLKTGDDLKLVIEKFGIKLYGGGVLAEGLVSRLTGQMRNLTGWLREELSGRSLEKVKAIYEKLGIPF
jgi:hypothetical protein